MARTWHLKDLFKFATKKRRQPIRKSRFELEQLEERCLFATNITQYHVDSQSTGANLTETQLTSSNVNAADFGKLYSTTVDGQVYAEPLVMTNVTITAGPNTIGPTGTYDSVVIVATQHDSLYAINAANGVILWHRTFLDTTNSNDFLPGASSVTSIPSGDTNSGDINPEVGITGTPVIDPSTNVIYVDPNTKETTSNGVFYVQRLHAINLANGTDAAPSYIIGTTTNGNTNNTHISVSGSGDGNVGGVVQFNALRENNRPALSLVNGTVYEEWASHGDNGPYHGWVVAWNVSNLSTQGMVLSGVLCTDPNGGEGGIWGGGGGLTWDPDEPNTFYFETGNGDPRGGPPPLNAQGFPTDNDYYESLVKVVLDSSTSANPNTNGWGMHITDYFTPSNVNALDDADEDFGSGSPLVLPDSAGIPGYPHLVVAAGKDGRIFLLNRDNLGKFNATGDNVLNSVLNISTGVYTAPTLINGSLSTPAYYHGVIYWVSGYNNNAQAYVIAPITNPSAPYDVASVDPISETANGNFGYLPGSVEVSANGGEDPQAAVVWIMDTANNELHAYSALSLSTELWNSGAGSLAAVKFATPDVANGEVFVGTQNNLTVFGLTGASVPVQAPSPVANLSAAALSGSSVELNWTDNTVSPNFATNYALQMSTNNVNFATVANAGQESTTYTVTGLSQNTTYYFQIVSSNSAGSSAASAPSASATTTNQSGTTPTAPVGLGAVPASGSEVYLNWTNTASNETGFTVTRATDSLFTQNVTVLHIASAPYYYTDGSAGLSPGNTFYYKIQASNSSGLSSSSNTASVAIPNVPPPATNAAAVQNGNTIVLSWTDHAGPFALGYQISRSIDGGPYAIYVDRPETSDSPPSTQTFTDTSVPGGHTYSYEILAENVSGFSAAVYASVSVLGTATLSLDNSGNLAFTVGGSVPDRLSVSLANGVYTLSDTAVTISVTGAGAGNVTLVNPSSATIPAADVAAMTLDTGSNGNQTDTITVTSNAVPITITADSGSGKPIINLGDPSNNESINGAITDASNGSLLIAGSGITTINGNLICQGSGGVTLSGGGTINIAGNISLGTGSLTDAGSGPVAISGVISGNAASGLVKTGSGTLTLSNANTYTGTTTIDAGTLVATANSAMGPANAAGIIVVAGGALAISGGINYAAAEPISLAGSGPAGNGAIENVNGSNTLAAPITLSAPATIGCDAGTFTLGGNISEGANPLTFVGAGNTVVSGIISSVPNTPIAGLTEGQDAGNVDTADPPNAVYGTDVELYPYMGETSGNDHAIVATSLHTWATNDTWIYQGQINIGNTNGNGTGTVSFAKSIDDSTSIKIDGKSVLYDANYTNSIGTGPLTLTAGWHNIDIRFANGGGGAGADGQNNNGWAGWTQGNANARSGIGFVYRVDAGPNDPKGQATGGNVANYVIPTDNGSGNLFRTAPAPGVTKKGAGTLDLMAANNYFGSTSVLAGKLLVDGQEVNAPLTVQSGGTLGGQGTIAATLVQLGGTLSPGDSPGTLTAASLALSSGSTYVEELGGLTAGTQYDQTAIAAGGTVGLGNATLNIALVNGFLPISGQQFTIISNSSSGSSPVSGTFSQGSTYSAAGYTYAINYAGGASGHDVVLTVTSTPGTPTTVTISPLANLSYQTSALPTLTATVTANSGSSAPTAGFVDFKDSTTGQDFGNGVFVSSTGLTSTFVLSSTQGTTPLTWGGATGLGADNGAAQTIAATYTPGSGFAGSIGTTSETVTPAALTLSGVTATKVYDGTVSFASASFTGGNLSGNYAVDALTFSAANYGTGTASSKNVGTVGLTASGFTVTGGALQKANYILAQPSMTQASGSATITTRALTVTANPGTKVYDGTTTAPNAPGITGSAAAGDTASFTETYDNRNVGAGKTLAASGSVIDGNGGNNYVVTFIANTTGQITARAITVTTLTTNRIYDGTATATPTITSGSVASGDAAAFTETYDTKNVGVGKMLTAAGSVSDGNGGNNYAVTLLTTTGQITARAITVTASTNTKNVDGTTSASNIPTVTAGSVATGDTAAFVETYDNANPGTGKTLIPIGSVNDGNGGNNYAVTLTANTTGQIIPTAPTTTTVSTSSPSVTYGNSVTFTATVTATQGTAAPLPGLVDFLDTTTGKDFGDGSFVASAGLQSTFTVTVSAANNSYLFNVTAGDNIKATYLPNGANFFGSSGSVSQTVTIRAITVTAATTTKSYDGTTAATSTPTITTGSLATGDTASFTETYDTKNVGTGKTLTATGSVSDGNGGNNYAVTFVTGITGQITPRAITVKAQTNTKAFDGTTSASNAPKITAGTVAPGDTAAFIETYDTPAIATGKTLTPSGSVSDGNGGNNYAVTFLSVFTGQITTAVTATNLYLQSVTPVAGNGFATNVSPGGTALLTTNGELTVQFATGLSNFSTSGFDGATLFFLYDHSVFAPLSSITTPVSAASLLSGAGTNNPYGLAKEINVNNTLLANATYPNGGQGMSLTVSVISGFKGTFDLVQVTIADPDGNSQIAAPSSDVLIGINLEPMTTVTATSLALYNSFSNPAKPDVISPSSGSNYALGLPTKNTTALNANYDFSASVEANSIATLSLGGWMNTASGAVASIPTITSAGGTATVYANLLNPMQTGAGLDSMTVVFNYDPTKVTIAHPNFNQANSSFQFGTVTNGNGVYASYYSTPVAQYAESPTDMEVVVGINDLQGTHPIQNSHLGDLFSVTFTLASGASGSGNTFVNLLPYSQAATGNPTTVLTDANESNQTFSPAIGLPPNGTAALDATLSYSLSSSIVATSSTLTSSSPSVTYGTAVTFTDSITAGSGSSAPTLGSVDFFDTTSHTDLTLGGISSGSTSGTVTTVSFVTGAKTLNYTAGDIIQATYTAGSGFSGSTATTTQVVNKRAITVTASTNTKGYDGTAAASNTPTVTSGTLVAGDTASFTEAYDTKNAGAGKTLTASGSVSDGNGSNNYTVTFVTNTTGQVVARAITVTAATNTRGYDGTTAASNTPTVTSGTVAAGDTASFTEAYDTKNAATGKTLTASGSVNDGNGGHNYVVTFVTSTTGQITARAITVTASTNTRGYDGTTTASNTPTVTSGTLVAGDTASFTEAYDTKNAGTGKTLTVSGSVSDGNGGNNYAVSFVTNTTGQVTARAITVTAATNTRGYDGTTAASNTPTVTSGTLVAGDTASFAEGYDTKNAGTGKTLTASGSVSDGNGGNNYTVTFVANTTGQVTVRAITVTAATNTKGYDGTTAASNTPMVTSGTVAAGDTASFTEGYDTRNAGTGKTLTATGSVSDGNGGNNYTVTFVTNTTGQVTVRAITVTAATNTKGYDGTTAASNTPTVTSGTLVAGDTASFTEAYDTRNAGTGKTLTATGSVSDGNGGNNYAVTFVTNTTGQVTARAVTVTAATNTKGYDGATTASNTPTVTSGTLVAGDTASFTEGYDTKNAGTGKTLTASGSVSDGNGGNNYAVTFVTNTTGQVTVRAVTVTAATNTKGYDGTTAASNTPTVTSGTLVAGDTAAFTEGYDTKNAGTGKTLTASGSVNDGNGGHNYAVSFVASTAGQVTARAITVAASTNTKTVDGTTSASNTATITSGSLAAGDTAAFTETYDNASVGTGKTLTPAGSINDGNSGTNYAVTLVSNTTGAIVTASGGFTIQQVRPSSEVAGTPFVIVVTAVNGSGQTNTLYSGTVTLTTSDSQGQLFPASGALSGGVGYFDAELKTVGGQTISANDAANLLSGTSSAITVTPAPTSQFAISGLPTNAVTGTPLSATVTAEDAYGNPTPSYTGTVHFTSTDPRISAGGNLPANYTFTMGAGQDNGVHTFTNGVTLLTPGTQTITVTDTNSSSITGTSSAIQAAGLQVSSVVGNPTGFTVNFNKAFDPNTLKLYGTLPNDPSLLFYMTNTNAGPTQLTGSVAPNATDTAFTFVETTFGAQNGGLPNGNYDVSLLSSANGLKDMAGVPLDASNSPLATTNLYSTLLSQSVAAYSNSFTLSTISAFTDGTQNTPAQVAISLASFAQGPGLPVHVQFHNSGGTGGTYPGIPATISDGNNASTVSLSVTYNTALLTVTGAVVDPSILGNDPTATFSRTVTGTPIAGIETDTFTFSTGNGSLLAKGTAHTLGEIVASVPNAAGQQIYKDKQVLTISNLSSDGAAHGGVTSANLVGGTGFEVVAYLGDASGDGNIQLNDATLANNVGNEFIGGGFPAFSKVDPVVLADTDGAGFVDSSSVGNIASLAIGHAQATIPTPPAGRITSSGGADPDLSLPGQVNAVGGLVEVPVNLDNAMPLGSTGLTQATLDLTYDPRMLSVSPSDVHLGSLPSLGTGWTVTTVVNQAVGQLVIDLYSLTPLTVAAAGSLVIVDFQMSDEGRGASGEKAFDSPLATHPAPLVSLVDWANPTGQVSFRTSLADTYGALTLGNSTGRAEVIGEGPVASGAFGVAVNGAVSESEAAAKNDSALFANASVSDGDGIFVCIGASGVPSDPATLGVPLASRLAPLFSDASSFIFAATIDVLSPVTPGQLFTEEVFSELARQNLAPFQQEWQGHDPTIDEEPSVVTAQALDELFAQLNEGNPLR